MNRALRTRSLFLFIIAVAFMLSACAFGQDAVPESPVEDASKESFGATKRGGQDGATKIIRLGSSPYAIRVAREFLPLPVSNENWEDDMVACYGNSSAFLDFSVYQFSKEGYPDTLEEFLEEEAEEYDASEIVTDETLNGVPMGRYRSIDNYGGVYREGMTYVFEADGDYIEVDFWFIGVQSERETRKIMESLMILESKPLPVGAYQISLAEDWRPLSGADGNSAVYRSGNASLYLSVSRFPANGATLADFVRGQGGSDIETDAEINGIPVAFYRSEQAFNRTLCGALTCALEDGGGFTELTFLLNGITAEEEAEAILKTLSAYP